MKSKKVIVMALMTVLAAAGCFAEQFESWYKKKAYSVTITYCNSTSAPLNTSQYEELITDSLLDLIPDADESDVHRIAELDKVEKHIIKDALGYVNLEKGQEYNIRFVDENRSFCTSFYVHINNVTLVTFDWAGCKCRINR